MSNKIRDLESAIGTPPWLPGRRDLNEITGDVGSLIHEWLSLQGMPDEKLRTLSPDAQKKCYLTKGFFDVVAGNRPKAIVGRHENAQWRNNLDLKTALAPIAPVAGLLDPTAEEIGNLVMKENSPGDTASLLLSIESAVTKTFTKERERIAAAINQEKLQLQEVINADINQKITLLGGDVSAKVLDLVTQNIQNGNLEVKLPHTLTEKIVSLAKAAVEELAWDIVPVRGPATTLPNEASQPELALEKQEDENPNPDPNPDPLIPTPDPYFYFDPEATRVMRSSLRRGFNLYGYGPTGCGKSELALQVHAKLRRRMHRVNCNGDITTANFIGQMHARGGETYFAPGALPKAMSGGYTLILDEIDFMPPHIGAMMHPVMEPRGKLYIPETGETISPSPGFQIWAFANTGGKGDTNGQYTGTEILNAAFLDRFAASLKMTYLPPDEEEKMLYKRFPGSEAQEIILIVKLATEVRNAFGRDELSRTLSTRKLIDYFSHREDGYTVDQALDLVLLNWLDGDDENLVRSFLDRVGRESWQEDL